MDKREIIALSLGATGAILIVSDQVDLVASARIEATDAIGAGVSIAGGMTLAFARGLGIDKTLRYGEATGSAGRPCRIAIHLIRIGFFDCPNIVVYKQDAGNPQKLAICHAAETPIPIPSLGHDLFRNKLDNIIDSRHELVQLARLIDWSGFDETFGRFYKRANRPALPTRLMVGLCYLKHAFDVIDERLLERWVENPLRQHFCGFE